MLAETELKLVSQIAELKRRHQLRRNFRRPLCRIPAEILTKSLSYLQYRRLRVGHRPIPTSLNNEFIFRLFSSHK